MTNLKNKLDSNKLIMLLIDGVRYNEWTPKDEEKEFHPMVKEHSKEIFGEDSIYFDIKYKIASPKSGIAGIPDAYVTTLSKPFQWYIVENELSSHPVYSHIVPQVSRFVDSIDELETQRDIRNVLNSEVERDIVLKAKIEKKTGMDPYRFLTELLCKSPIIALIIDELTPEVEQASKSLKKLANTEIIEFRTFLRDGVPSVHAHMFNPLHEAEEVEHAKYDKSKKEFFCFMGDAAHNSQPYNVIEIVKHLADDHNITPDDQIIADWTKDFEKKWKDSARHIEKKKTTMKLTNWTEELEWTNDSVKEIVTTFFSNMSQKFPDLFAKPQGKYYAFYRGKAGTRTKFAAIILHKNDIAVRVRVDPITLSDPKGRISERFYKGWFFTVGKGQEREFKIADKEQVSYAMELIKQSYDLTK